MGEKIATSENVTVLHFSFKCFLVCFYEPKCSISNIGSGSLLYYNKNKQKPNLKTWSTYVKYKQDQQHEHQQSNSLSSTECGVRYIYPWHQLRPVRLITHRQHRAQVRLMKLIARERDRRAERHDILLTDS